MTIILDTCKGNPFLAIVVDPLRTLHLNEPQLKAFRAYPPEYSSPALNQCPDGTIEADERVRLEKWGSCWNRYYEIQVEYFMSTAAKNIMDVLTQNLWMRGLQTTTSITSTTAAETFANLSSKVGTIRDAVKHLNVESVLNRPKGSSDVMAGESLKETGEHGDCDMNKISQSLMNLAAQEIHHNLVEEAKRIIFS